MASLVLSGDTSGSITVSAPAVSGSNTQTLAAVTGTLAPIVSSTVVTTTGGTSIDFTSIPSWVKRITVMLSGVSTSGTAYVFLQLGTGSTTYTTSGYVAQLSTTGASSISTAQQTTGFCLINPSAAAGLSGGSFVLTNLSGNIWTGFGSTADTTGTRMYLSSGTVTLGAALTAVRVTTTDTIDVNGGINILYE
jgi:hypothetical protein